jgi:hypothetical protein
MIPVLISAISQKSYLEDLDRNTVSRSYNNNKESSFILHLASDASIPIELQNFS